jgi:hypothetical protein
MSGLQSLSRDNGNPAIILPMNRDRHVRLYFDYNNNDKKSEMGVLQTFDIVIKP